MKLSFFKGTFWQDKPYLITTAAIFLGMVLSIISWTQVCTKACGEVHTYRFFGMPVELFGTLFFTSVGILHLLSKRYTTLSYVVLWVFMGGLGAESMLMIIQKYEIGYWCLICLSITFAIVIGLGGSLINYKKWLYKQIQQGYKRAVTKRIAIGLITLPFFCLGFIITFLGVAKPEDMHIYNPPSFGNNHTGVSIYFFTDWFCPSCKKIEENMHKLYPEIIKKASLTFVDRPIHTESKNFIPYNLSFMHRNQDKYFEIRHLLHELASEDSSPSLADVQKAVAPLGITYEQIDYADIENAMSYYEQLSKTYNVDRTPMLIIVSHEQVTRLSGGQQISNADILKIIADLAVNAEKKP